MNPITVSTHVVLKYIVACVYVTKSKVGWVFFLNTGTLFQAFWCLQTSTNDVEYESGVAMCLSIGYQTTETKVVQLLILRNNCILNTALR